MSRPPRLRDPAQAARWSSETYTRLHDGAPPRSTRPVKSWPDAPRALVDLGLVLAIEYEKRVPRSALRPEGIEHRRHEFKGWAAPAIAHDETGRLHLLGGRYTTTQHGIEDTMAKGFSLPSLGKFPMRSNPSFEGRAMEYVTIGIVAFLSAVLMDIVSDRITSLSERTKGIIKGVVGVVGGALIAKKWPTIGLGFGVGLVASAADTLYREMGVQAYINRALAGVGSGSQTNNTQQQQQGLPPGGAGGSSGIGSFRRQAVR